MAELGSPPIACRQRLERLLAQSNNCWPGLALVARSQTPTPVYAAESLMEPAACGVSSRLYSANEQLSVLEITGAHLLIIL